MKIEFSKKPIYKNLLLALTLSIQPLLLVDNALAQSNVRIINSKSSTFTADNSGVDEEVRKKAQNRLKEIEQNYKNEIKAQNRLKEVEQNHKNEIKAQNRLKEVEQNHKNEIIDDKEYSQPAHSVKKTSKKSKKHTTKSKGDYANGEFVGKVVDGMGSDVSYNEVISQVIPSNWHIKVDHEIQNLMSARTSWVGGKGWVKILQETFNNSGIAVIINVAKKQVHFQSELSFVAKSKGYGFQIFPTDKTLRAAFSRWAQQAGYQFVWDVPRDIPNHGMYFASKKDLEGALDEIISAINMDSDLHISAIIHETEGQKVLRITKFIKEAGK